MLASFLGYNDCYIMQNGSFRKRCILFLYVLCFYSFSFFRFYFCFMDVEIKCQMVNTILSTILGIANQGKATKGDFMKLVQQQTFCGSWTLNTELADILKAHMNVLQKVATVRVRLLYLHCGL